VIRCIRVGDQVVGDADSIAFWDTVTDRFLSIDGSQMWDSYVELNQDIAADTSVDGPRLLRLIPSRWPDKTDPVDDASSTRMGPADG
jgi:hypothetical protein